MDQEGWPYASHPTLLGNILAEYETYPELRHGMDAVFYWPRLWLQLDKDRKEEIDSTWAVADGLLALSSILVVGGLAYVGVAVSLASDWLFQGLPSTTTAVPFGFNRFSGTATSWCIAGVCLVALAYALYRISLPFHQRNGTVFKAVFDLYRHTLAEMTRVGPTETAVWQGAWAYLQYLRVHCQNCLEYFPASEKTCPTCKYPANKSLEALRRPAGPGGSEWKQTD